MTWSVVARDPLTGDFGIAVTTRFFAVGAVVPHMRARHGAVATQAFVSPLWGTIGLELLASGLGAEAVLASLLSFDEGRASRQIHLIDRHGCPAAFTGPNCIDWCGHLVADQVSVAGNMLCGSAVIERTLETYLANRDKPFAERLLDAMDAGEAAGGDKRGRQSAALRIHRGEDYPWLDLRVDDHGAPLTELRRLHAVAQERFLHVAETFPTKDKPSGLIDRTGIDREIQALEQARIAAGRKSASFATD